MEFQRGQVVRSKAGHDKGDYQVIIAVELPYLILCDGKRRRLEKPKRKKAIHVGPANTVLHEDQMKTNRQIKKAIRLFQEKTPMEPDENESRM